MGGVPLRFPWSMVVMCWSSEVVAYMVLLAAWPDTDLDHEESPKKKKHGSGFGGTGVCGKERLFSRSYTHLNIFFWRGRKGGCYMIAKVCGWHYGHSWCSGFECPETGILKIKLNWKPGCNQVIPQWYTWIINHLLSIFKNSGTSQQDFHFFMFQPLVLFSYIIFEHLWGRK